MTGLSLKSQELTALFLAVRLYCSFVMEYDIHTILDTATLATTLWVMYMIRFKLRSSYMEDKDNFAIFYVVSPLLSLPCVLNFVKLFSAEVNGVFGIYRLALKEKGIKYILIFPLTTSFMLLPFISPKG